MQQESNSRGLPSSPSASFRSSSITVPRRTTSSSSNVGGGLAQSMAKSMTIDEMRVVHQRALRDAEAKRMELRLVLASRYRELVGSSDEVIKMNERASELLDLVQNLPQLLDRVADPLAANAIDEPQEEKVEAPDDYLQRRNSIRTKLANYPRLIHRAMHKKDIFLATTTLREMFTIIATLSSAYPLAISLSNDSGSSGQQEAIVDDAIATQIRMLFLQMESLPSKLLRVAREMLENVNVDSRQAAAASATLFLLHQSIDAEALLNTYFEAKAKLVVETLGKLNQEAENAESALTKIVGILQRDIILHPYSIFILRKVGSEQENFVDSLPMYDREKVKVKCSKFLATHLPMIRSKVKTVLVSIAGTTASALGQIRQSLYDTTDGSTERLSTDSFTWEEAIDSMVDLRNTAESTPKFSLWSSLFSTTFSSLVHSLLTTAFQSVHSRVISTLKEALAKAPSGGGSILPHEAYRNTLKIANILDKSLQKVREDAHELLVHAEERVESERRLRESLYVQTAEILGRLVSDVRCLASESYNEPIHDLIVARLCFQLKHRLSSLPFLLSADSSPSTGGMISYVDLESAFELADDDEDGVIPYSEAKAAVESAFAGTPFKASDMIHETSKMGTFTLEELALLTARGLHHEKRGSRSALGTFHSSLDTIVDSCFKRWSIGGIGNARILLQDGLAEYAELAEVSTVEEWKHVFSLADKEINSVSPHLVGFLLRSSMCLNENLCPMDCLVAQPKVAESMDVDAGKVAPIFRSSADIMRKAVAAQTLAAAIESYENVLRTNPKFLDVSCEEAKLSFYADVSFLQVLLERSQVALGTPHQENLSKLMSIALKYLSHKDHAIQMTSARHEHVLGSCHVFLRSLFQLDIMESKEEHSKLTNNWDPLFTPPLTPSRRFALLPVQADRSLSDLEIRGKYAREKKSTTSAQPDVNSANAISSGFGFLSGMLKGTARK